MRLSRVVVLGVALVAGLIAAFLALNLTSGAPPPPAAPGEVQQADIVHVLVAAKDISMGTTVSDSDIAWHDWPRTASSAAFIMREGDSDAMKKVVGSLVRSTFYAGEPITEGKLIRSDRGFMAAILPAGKRAVATKIAADTSAGGFILPNDRVDVILSRRDREAEKASGVETHTSDTILSDVRVLAIDQMVQEKDGQRVVVGKTATLELTQRQAETLAVSRQTGSLSLALRSIVDANGAKRTESEDEKDAKNGNRINMVRFGISTSTIAK
jgi:pilus assembly protein CpaB